MGYISLTKPRWQHTRLPPLRSEFKSRPDLKWESWKWRAIGQWFTVQNLDKLYVLVFSSLLSVAI